MTAPIKFIEVAVTNVAESEYTNISGLGRTPYRWTCKLNVTPQAHGDATTTPMANFYTGRNINVGDWILSDATGRAVKIIAISSQTDSAVVATVEDVNSQNVMNSNDPNPYGMIPNGSGVKAFVFEVKNNVPILSNIPAALPGSLAGTQFAANIMNRDRKSVV